MLTAHSISLGSISASWPIITTRASYYGAAASDDEAGEEEAGEGEAGVEGYSQRVEIKH